MGSFPRLCRPTIAPRTAAAVVVVVTTLLAAFGIRGAAAVNVTVAGMFPLSQRPWGVMQKKAAELAVEAVNNDPSLLPNNTLRLVFADTSDHPIEAAANLMAVATDDVVATFETDGTESVSVALATLSAVLDVPFVSPNTDESDLTEEDYYRFLRLRVLIGEVGETIHAVFKSLGWGSMDIIVGDVTDVGDLVEALIDANSESGDVVDSGFPSVHVDIASSSQAEWEASVDDLLSAVRGRGQRAVLLLSDATNARAILYRATQQGMVNGGRYYVPGRAPYAWLGHSSWFVSPDDFFQPDAYCDAACVATLREAMRGVLVLDDYRPPAYAQWLTDVWNPATSSASVGACEASLSGAADWSLQPPPREARVPAVYDAVRLIAMAVHALCTDGVPLEQHRPGRGAGGNHVVAGELCVDGAVEATAIEQPDPPLSTEPSLSGEACAAAAQEAPALQAAIDAVAFDGLSGRVESVNGDRPVLMTLYYVDDDVADGWRSIATATDTNVTYAVEPATFPWPGGQGVPAAASDAHCVVGEHIVSSLVDGRTSCAACPAGTTGRTTADGAITCVPCPTGMVCEGGNQLLVAAGYWLPPPDDTAANSTTIQPPFACRPVADACCPSGRCPVRSASGALLFDLTAPGAIFTVETSAEVVGNNSQCAVGHGGRLCTSCADGFSPHNGECLPCSSTRWHVLVIAEVVVFVVTLVYTVEKVGDGAIVTLLVDYLQLLAVVVSVRQDSAMDVVDVEFSVFSLSLGSMSPNSCVWDQSPMGAVLSGYYLPLAVLLHAAAMVVVVAAAKRFPACRRVCCSCVCCRRCRALASEPQLLSPPPPSSPLARSRAAKVVPTPTASAEERTAPSPLRVPGGATTADAAHDVEADGSNSASQGGSADGSDTAGAPANPPPPQAPSADAVMPGSPAFPQRAVNRGMRAHVTPMQRLKSSGQKFLSRATLRLQHVPPADLFIRVMLRALFLCYLGLSETSMKLFNCREVQGVSVLEAEPSVRCFTTQWYLAVFLLALPTLVLVTLGLPGSIVWMGNACSPHRAHNFRTHYRYLATSGQLAHASGQGTTAPPVQPPVSQPSHHKPLPRVMKAMMLDLRFYREDVRQWYHAVFLFRRAVMTFVLVALLQAVVVRQLGFFVVAVLSVVLQAYVRPYRTDRDNLLGFLLGCCILLISGLELLRVTLLEVHSETSTDAGGDWRVQMVNVLVIMAVCAPALGLVIVSSADMFCT